MWREVSDFSARNVGERVHTSPTHWARASRWSWVETVRYLLPRKKGSSLGFVRVVFAGVAVVVLSVGAADDGDEDEDEGVVDEGGGEVVVVVVVAPLSTSCAGGLGFPPDREKTSPAPS